MTELATQVFNQPFACVELYRQAACRERTKPANIIPTQEVLMLGGILILLQILDGMLTAIGVSSFGIAAEGNPFIRHLMDQFGYLPALIFVKTIAVFIIGYLCLLANQVVWIPGAMKGLIGIYLSAAIIPWSAILFVHLA